MRIWLACLGVLMLAVTGGWSSQNSSSDRTTLIIVMGAPGEAEYGSNFVRQASLWEKAGQQANCRRITLGLEGSETNDFERLRQTLESEP